MKQAVIDAKKESSNVILNEINDLEDKISKGTPRTTSTEVSTKTLVRNDRCINNKTYTTKN